VTDPADIRIPGELLPADGRFGSGPSRVRVEAVDALAATGSGYMGTSHRREGVRAVVRRIRRGLAEMYGLPDSYEVLLGVGGTTAFWDAAAFGLVEQRSQHAVFGEFSAKFAAVTRGAPWLDEPEIVEAEPGTHPLPIPDPEVDAFCLTHNETSTGVMMPIVRPRGDGALVLVDATSAAGAAPVDPLEFDAYYFSPQKAFGSEGGLWVALCSPAAVTRIAALDEERWIPPFSRLRLAVQNARLDQTYNTPALATLYLLDDQIRWILERGGLGWASEHCSRASAAAYSWAEASDYAEPFVSIAHQRSITTATIDLVPDVAADAVTIALAANGIVDLSGYRKLGRNQLRIATFPNTPVGDVEKLVSAIDFVVERL
jgi:phosphoserine aminotransferase